MGFLFPAAVTASAMAGPTGMALEGVAAATTAAAPAAGLFSMQNLALASLGLGIGGTMSSFMAQRGAAKTEADIYAANVASLKEEAEGIIEEGKSAADILRERSKRFLSTQRARYAATGAEISGSPLLVMAEDYGQAERDVQETLRMSELKAEGIYGQAGIMGAKGKAAGKAATIRGWTTLLGGGAQALSQYAMLRYLPTIKG